MTFTYTLANHGWADARISDGVSTRSMHASYLSDSLHDMATSIRTILAGHKSSTFSFIDEPGEHRLHLQHLDDSTIQIRVEWFEDWPDNISGAGKTVFHTTCSFDEFISVFVAPLRQIHDEIGPAEYRRRWVSHDFPTDLYREILSLIPHRNAMARD